MPSIFSKIVSGEIPAHKIAEDDRFLAFLDVFPLVEGHTLVIPKLEVDYIFDLDDDTFSGLQLFSKKVAKALRKAIPCKRIGTAVVGLEVPHTHIHLVPLQHVSDMDFSRPKLTLSSDQLADIAQRIRREL